MEGLRKEEERGGVGERKGRVSMAGRWVGEGRDGGKLDWGERGWSWSWSGNGNGMDHDGGGRERGGGGQRKERTFGIG